MTNDPGLRRRVTRLENDTESLYELVTEVRSGQDEHTRHFERIEGSLSEVRSTLGTHAGRFDQIESTLDGHAQRFDRIETTLNGHAQRFDSIETTLGGHAQRFDSIESTLGEVLRRLPEPT